MLYEIVATLFYLGKLPAPGTLGTLVGLGIAYIVSFNLWTLLVTIFSLFIVGLVATTEVIRRRGDPDPEEVILDEVVGFLTCFVLVELSPKTALASFILFRVLDILKPFPINLFERFPGAFGVMLDDVAAGLMTSLLLFLLLQ